MKKIDLSNVVSGVRKIGAVKQTLEHIQEGYVEATANLIKGLLNGPSVPVILHGVVNSGAGVNYNISAGAIWHNDEVFEIAAFVASATGGDVPVLSLVTTFRPGDPVKYSDGSTYNTHAIRKYAWSFGPSGSGLADLSDVVTIKTRIHDELLDIDGTIAALIGDAPGALDTLNELAAALADDANFAATVTTALAGKVPTTRLVSTSGGLQGGGDLSADRTLSIANAGVTNLKVNDTVFAGERYATTDDLNTFVGGNIVWVQNTAANVPASGDFLVITYNKSLSQTGQLAIGTSGATGGSIYHRTNTLGTWGSWTLINDPAA